MKITIVVLIWLLISLALKFQSKFSFAMALFCIIAAFASEILGRPGMALNIITISYGFAAAGTFFYIKETRDVDKKI